MSAPEEEFEERSVGELALRLDLEDESDVVSFDVVDPLGNLVMKELSFARFGHGTDFDQVGGYRWVRITLRLEAPPGERDDELRPYEPEEIPVGACQVYWTSEGEQNRVVLETTDMGAGVKVIFNDGSEAFYGKGTPIHFYPPLGPRS